MSQHVYSPSIFTLPWPSRIFQAPTRLDHTRRATEIRSAPTLGQLPDFFIGESVACPRKVQRRRQPFGAAFTLDIVNPALQ